jgi:hypothetical protein
VAIDDSTRMAAESVIWEPMTPRLKDWAPAGTIVPVGIVKKRSSGARHSSKIAETLIRMPAKNASMGVDPNLSVCWNVFWRMAQEIVQPVRLTPRVRGVFGEPIGNCTDEVH